MWMGNRPHSAPLGTVSVVWVLSHNPLTPFCLPHPQQECAAPASVTLRRPEPAMAQMRTSSLSTWTADSRSLVRLGPRTPSPPQPGPLRMPWPRLGAAGVGMWNCSLSPSGRAPGTLGDWHSCFVCQCRVLSCHSPQAPAGCWKHTPRPQALIPAAPTGSPVPTVPLLPLSQIHGNGLPTDRRTEPGERSRLTDATCQDSM